MESYVNYRNDTKETKYNLYNELLKAMDKQNYENEI